MSGVGPVEPGEGTYASDGAPAAYADRPRRGRPAALAARHPRTAIAVAVAGAVAAGASYLYVTRPAPHPPPPTPWPAQAVSVGYGGDSGRPESGHGSFDFTITVTTTAGPPVTVERITQNSAALRLSTTPATPFTVRTEKPRNVRVVIQVTECRKVARNAGLPFLDITLRNVRAIQEHSYILGDRYARDLASALGVACPEDRMSVPKPPDSPARSQHADKTNQPEFPRSTHQNPLCITPWHNKSVTSLARPLHLPQYRA